MKKHLKFGYLEENDPFIIQTDRQRKWLRME